MLNKVVTATAIALSIGVAGATVRPDMVLALDNAQLIAQTEGAPTPQAAQPAHETAQPGVTGTAPAAEPQAGAEAAQGADTPDVSVNEILEDQQVAHDKYVVDRFLLGVSVVFALIAAALLFSLPPKQREQKE